MCVSEIAEKNYLFAAKKKKKTTPPQIYITTNSGVGDTMVANMNVEKFIDDIYERPVIWNRSYSGNKPYLDETWTEMGQLHKLASKYIYKRCTRILIVICIYNSAQWIRQTCVRVETGVAWPKTCGFAICEIIYPLNVTITYYIYIYVGIFFVYLHLYLKVYKLYKE